MSLPVFFIFIDMQRNIQKKKLNVEFVPVFTFFKPTF